MIKSLFYCFIYSLLFLPFLSFAQLNDDFSDGDFTNNPPWSGDASQFIINLNKQLQLNASAAGSSYLSTPLNLSSLDTIEWRFFIHLDFSPSDYNFARVYLTSDQQNLNGSLNGYYLQFGENGSNDAVGLFRQSGTATTSVCKGTNGQIANPFSIGVKVTRDNSGNWTLSVDAAGGTNYTQEATGNDNTFSSSAYFGILCTYTVSNINNFYFDNVNVEPVAADTTHTTVSSPYSGDVIINEILFSAKTGGAEFVEIYNQSSKAIDLSTMSITKRNLTTLLTDSSVQLTTSGYLQPQSYLALTTNAAAVKNQYYTPDTNAFLEMPLPNLLTNEDIVVLQDGSGNTLDELHYYSSWHFPLLKDVHGVSLERLSASRPTNDSTNWHSAAESAGFATPGYRNSQYDDVANGSNEVTVEPEIFSPDNDGKNDVVNIIFHFNTPGYVANVKVFDAKGRHVRNLVENILIGNDGTFSWDGINDKKEKARTGIYVFYIQVWDTNGSVKEYKRTCVLATRL